MKITLAACAGLLVLAFAQPATAQEKKKFEPWKLTFQSEKLDVLVVSYRDGSARTFYYLPFTVSNKGKVPAQLGLHLVAHVGSDPRKRKSHIALPFPDAELFYKRMARSKDIKNVQDINAMKTLAPGQSVKGIAVFGTFDRHWDNATIDVTGLEPRAISTRVRNYGNNGFTLAHRAYHRHNKSVLKKVGKDAEYTEPFVVLQHRVALKLKFHREGDEFAPQLDPIFADGEDWDVLATPPPKIVLTKKLPYAK
ncbi:MAG: hypothetical protein ACYTGZ_06470 [Planctomycetota bacterium]|jgi:hypothetical protein